MTTLITTRDDRQQTVAVWTPWGVQSVPKQALQVKAIRRLAAKLSGAKSETANPLSA